jgi:DNA excision repair protein ERCC-2
MSGTLVPTEMYADLFGLEKSRTKLEEYTSPFPKENRLNIIDTEITTAYQSRNEEMFKNIGVKISDIASSLPGNLAVFFPSYELLEKTLPYLQSYQSNATIIREERNMSKSEKEELFEMLVSLRKSKKKGVLLGVQGGSLSEGIDYSDNLLTGVIVVGLPLSPPTVESEALISYYESKFGSNKGKYYGYINPAMNKVLQACGRLIRSEKDRGVVVLMDKRFEWSMYAKCFPKDFSAIKTPKPEKECINFYSN